jgi:hypothetical protein
LKTARSLVWIGMMSVLCGLMTTLLMNGFLSILS